MLPSQPVRLAFVMSRSSDQLSGGLVYNDRLVSYLRGAGDEVEVIAVPPHGSLSALARNLFGPLGQQIRQGNFDLLLQDEYCFASLFELNQRLQIPKVAVVHHLTRFEPAPLFRRWAIARLERRYLRGVDAFVCSSATTLGAIRRIIQAAAPTVVAHPGSDGVCTLTDEDVIARANEPGPLRLLSVGSVVPRKGLDVLLTAIAATKDVTLDVVGGLDEAPGFAARIRQQAAMPALVDRVRIHGRIDAVSLAGLYSHAQVVALPSTYEGFGMVYLEAMARGVVPLGSTQGGARELIHHRDNGFLVAPGDVATLAGLLQRLANDRDELGRLGRNALATARSWPTWDNEFAAVRELIESQLGRRR